MAHFNLAESVVGNQVVEVRFLRQLVETHDFVDVSYSESVLAFENRKESNGDQDLNQPLYAMGIQGVFTKTLDTALLNEKIDIAVHSLKDVPTLLPKGINIKAVLSRGNPMDVLVYNPAFMGWETEASIGTGSLRRKAQWLRKNPKHQVENLRGNLQKRIEKLNNSIIKCKNNEIKIKSRKIFLRDLF